MSKHNHLVVLADFPGSKLAGTKLLEMLRLGKSKPWKEVMEIMTGTPKMDTGAFREYFAPLEKWLTKYNKDKNNWVGCGCKERRFFLKQRLPGYDRAGQGRIPRV